MSRKTQTQDPFGYIDPYKVDDVGERAISEPPHGSTRDTRPILYWTPEHQPQDFVKTSLPPSAARVVAALKLAPPNPPTFRGQAMCRICGKPVGQSDFYGWGFYWPQGAEHYIEEHGVWPHYLDAFARALAVPEPVMTAHEIATFLETRVKLEGHEGQGTSESDVVVLVQLPEGTTRIAGYVFDKGRGSLYLRGMEGAGDQHTLTQEDGVWAYESPEDGKWVRRTIIRAQESGLALVTVPMVPADAAAREAILFDLLRGPRPLYPDDPYGLTLPDRPDDAKWTALANRYGLDPIDFRAVLTEIVEKGKVDGASFWNKDNGVNEGQQATLHLLVGGKSPNYNYLTDGLLLGALNIEGVLEGRHIRAGGPKPQEACFATSAAGFLRWMRERDPVAGEVFSTYHSDVLERGLREHLDRTPGRA